MSRMWLEVTAAAKRHMLIIIDLTSPRLPVDHGDVSSLNSKNIQWISFKLYMSVHTS